METCILQLTAHHFTYASVYLPPQLPLVKETVQNYLLQNRGRFELLLLKIL